MDKQCKACGYLVDIPGDKNRGECHRYPPTPKWPIVNKSTFCGGHTDLTSKTDISTGGKFSMKTKTCVTIICIALVAMLSWFTAMAFAANTITYERGTINIVPDGSTDFKWTELTGAPANGILVYSIQFNPSAANDRIKVRHGTTGGTITWDTNPAGSTAPLIKYYPEGKRLKLVIADSDCTYTTPASAQIIIEVGDKLR